MNLNNLPRCQFHKIDTYKYICQKCNVEWIDQDQIGHSPERICQLHEDVKFPSMWARLNSYKDAYLYWMERGKPMRTQECIDNIFDNICSKCDKYNGYACRICGCYINKRLYLNKLAWGTTKCPANPPKWIEDNGFAIDRLEQTNDILSEDNILPPPTEEDIELSRIEFENNLRVPTPDKPQGGCGCNRTGGIK
jgi:hypothetical protein